MTLKGAAVLALIGSILMTVLTVWRFILAVLNSLNGLVASVVVISSLIEAFAWLSVAIFFYVFYRNQTRG